MKGGIMDFNYCCFDYKNQVALIKQKLKIFNAIIFNTNCKSGECRIYTKEKDVESLFQKNNESLKLTKTNDSDNFIILDAYNDIAGDILAYQLGSITFHPGL